MLTPVYNPPLSRLTLLPPPPPVLRHFSPPFPWTTLMLANTRTSIPGLLYSSVQRRERASRKKQKRATEEEEENAGARERIETYCWQEMNFYDIYFKSFFHRGVVIHFRAARQRNQDLSSFFANTRMLARSPRQIAHDRLCGSALSRQNNLNTVWYARVESTLHGLWFWVMKNLKQQFVILCAVYPDVCVCISKYISCILLS